jgi:DNA (cytosine-5)-methyltransferase 1
MNSPLTVADLFSGTGGLSLGFTEAGFKAKFALDFDWDAVQNYRLYARGIQWLCKDIRKVSCKEIQEVAGLGKDELDVLVAGIPCEGYSLLNRRYDPSDPRNYLFLEFVRIARDLQPRAVVIENVPGLARRANGEFKDAIENALRRLNYTVNCFRLNASQFGVPQRRVRLFFVGTRKGNFEQPPPTHQDLSEDRLDRHVPGLSPKLTVRDAISDLPKVGPGETKDHYESEPLTEFQRVMREGSQSLHNHSAPNHPAWTVKMISETRQGEPLYGTFKQRIRLKWDEPAPTIPAGGVRPQWFYAHPEQPRGLTVREMARLQSFPDSYVFHGSLIKQRILVGDAVPPLLAKAIATSVKLALG